MKTFFLVLTGLAVLFSLRPADAGTPRAGAVRITQYVRDTRVVLGKSSAAVLEIVNSTRRTLVIPIRYMFDMQQVKGVRLLRVKRGWGTSALVLKAWLPPGAEPLRFPGPNGRIPRAAYLRLPPGKSGFLKLRIDAHDFALGECKFQFVLHHGPTVVARSQITEIDCVRRK